MATIQGHGGSITFPDFTGKFQAWTAQLSDSVYDTTGFGDEGWRTREPGIVRLTGTASGVCIEETPVIDANALGAPTTPANLYAAVVLVADTGNQWACSVVVSSIQFSRPEDGAMTFTITFSSNGRITETWA